jgi:DNA-binding transcriptional MerR regulator
MLRIGDFSQLAQISIRTLRLYDEMGLVKPAHIDPFTEYRYYQVEQLPRVNRILALKDLGLSLEQIKQLLSDDMPLAMLQQMLSTRQAEMDLRLREEQARLSRVRARLQQIEEELLPPAYDVVLKKLDTVVIAGARTVVPTYGEMTQARGAMLDRLYQALRDRGIPPLLPELALYHETEYKETDVQLEMATVVDPAWLDAHGTPGASVAPDAVHLRTLPGEPLAACLVHHGPFWGVPNAIVALFGWLGRHGYASTGAIRESHLFGREYDLMRSRRPGDTENPVVTVELQLPVEVLKTGP